MRKSLVPIGNSLGIVIERPILELLGITRSSAIEVTTDGRRLILEPVREQVEYGSADQAGEGMTTGPDFTDPRVTVRTLDALVKAFHMDNERFRRLHHAKNYENTIKAHRDYAATRPTRFQSGGTNEATARRLHECLDALQRGESWDAAIEYASKQVPR